MDTSRPVMSQYFFCGRSEGGASMFQSEILRRQTASFCQLSPTTKKNFAFEPAQNKIHPKKQPIVLPHPNPQNSQVGTSMGISKLLSTAAICFNFLNVFGAVYPAFLNGFRIAPTSRDWIRSAGVFAAATLGVEGGLDSGVSKVSSSYGRNGFWSCFLRRKKSVLGR